MTNKTVPLTTELDKKDIVVEEIKKVEERLEESGILTTELIAEVKKLVTAEIVSELKEDNILKEKELEIRREQENIKHANYVALKMESNDPWIEIVGDIISEEKGQRIELNWNNSFIALLKKNGIVADTEERAVQKYVGLLLKDIVDKDEGRFGSDYE